MLEEYSPKKWSFDGTLPADVLINLVGDLDICRSRIFALLTQLAEGGVRSALFLYTGLDTEGSEQTEIPEINYRYYDNGRITVFHTGQDIWEIIDEANTRRWKVVVIVPAKHAFSREIITDAEQVDEVIDFTEYTKRTVIVASETPLPTPTKNKKFPCYLV